MFLPMIAAALLSLALADQVKAECRNGILGLLLPRAERDKPRSIKVSVS